MKVDSVLHTYAGYIRQIDVDVAQLGLVIYVLSEGVTNNCCFPLACAHSL